MSGGVSQQPKDRQTRVTGKVVGITDGDTITLHSPDKSQLKIRLEGIDAPEASQEYGNKSKQALATLIAGKMISAAITGQDRYGRSLAWLDVDGVSVNRRMVADGWAWQYTKYNQDPEIAALQANAKAKRLGLWAAPNEPMPPWDFRTLGRDAATAPAPAQSSPPAQRQTQVQAEPQPKKEASGSGKYWINSNGVRHNASCRWYGRTKSGHYSNEAEGRGCGMCGG